MKNELTFTAHFGDDKKEVELSIPDGLPSNTWYVNVDNRYYGRVEKINGVWCNLDLKRFNSEDYTALCESIDRFLKDNGANEDELFDGAFDKYRD